MKKYQELLGLARQALESECRDQRINIPQNIKEKFGRKQACFVTLTRNGALRGCIGSLEARQELWKDVIENAVNAGFRDHRFSALEEDELDSIKIEVSVLSKPEKLGRGKEVFDKIKNNMGIILKCNGSSSTFLPQVWKQIPDKNVFLEELSMKAGLDKDAWKDSEIWFYKVEKVGE